MQPTVVRHDPAQVWLRLTGVVAAWKVSFRRRQTVATATIQWVAQPPTRGWVVSAHGTAQVSIIPAWIKWPTRRGATCVVGTTGMAGKAGMAGMAEQSDGLT